MGPQDNSTNGSPPESGLLLRRLDQAAIALILAVSLGVIVLSWNFRGCRRGGMIDIERTTPQAVEFQVDVNTADWPELSLLPDVGEVLAKRIVESRQKDGPFVDHGDLRRVSGIGPKTLEGLRPYLLPLPGASDASER